MAPRRRKNRPQEPFAYKLVLNQWLFSLFGLPSTDGFFTWNGNRLPLLEAFKQKFQLSEDSDGGLDENNIHRFHFALINETDPLPELPASLLLEYDQNIVRHTQRLNERRVARGDEPIVWRYFQYLSLLFTEIYLDRYFSDPSALIESINEQIERYNAEKPEADHVPALDPDADVSSQLNRLAFWSATGSGKTLIMHANIHQYRHYLAKHRRQRELNRIILLTPNEGLSYQHLAEFHEAGIEAELFDKYSRGLFSGQAVEIIDINKLRDEMGDKTVAVDAFEDNNLVLVDEGHRGASSGDTGAWMRFRNTLCEKGFSFEYSATFGQAVKNNNELTAQYARAVIFDYSYKHFYGDGYGKDYQILNLDAGIQENTMEAYLVACLLSFFQQLRFYEEQEVACRPFNVEKPLWVFVGGKVTAALSNKDASDIIEILRFLARFNSDRAGSVERIRHILNSGLVAADGRNLFAGRFAYLNEVGITPEQAFEEIQVRLFNAPRGGALYVENIKGVSGEIALRLGDNEPFGVINVGDDSKLSSQCDDEEQLVVTDREFKESLFQSINAPDSTINLLIGSRKFTEGWNSWRVSTMGLMNIGKSEGSQIIQLFGRGVRLKGYNGTLKRSSRVSVPDNIGRPRHLPVLETLNVFGIKADYMAQFRQFLEEEGLPANEERIEFHLPVIKNLGKKKLKTIRLKKEIKGVSTEFGDAFKKLGPVPTLAPPKPDEEASTRYLQKNPVVLNWYPKIQALRSSGVASSEAEGQPESQILTEKHLAFLDIDALYFELQRFKAERGWHNLNIKRDALLNILNDSSWYKLYIPEEELGFDSFDKVHLWQEVAESLLKKYCDRYYSFRKREWELPHLEYRYLDETDTNFPQVNENNSESYYRVIVEESQTEIVEKIKELKAELEAGHLKRWEFRGLKSIPFGRHLYEPLLHLTGSAVEVSPVPLNEGERRFVEDLKAFCERAPEALEDKELYLLRNLSKGRGVGFFEAGNFHPDFIVWILGEEREHISFVDPKGIRNIGAQDPKIQFYRTIKELESRLGDPAVTLNSFVVSNTPSHEMELMWSVEKEQMKQWNILFQKEDQEEYIGELVETAISGRGEAVQN